MKIGFDGKRVFHNTTGLGNYSRDLIRIMVKYFPNDEYFIYNPKLKKISPDSIDNKIASEKQYEGSKMFSFYWRLKTILKNLKEDNVSIFHGLSGEIPIGIQKTKIKSIVTIHDLIFIRYPKLYSFIDRKIYKWKFYYAAQKSNLIVAVSEQTKRDVVEFLNVPSEKVKVIYQGCSDVFKIQYSEEEKKQLKIKYNLPEKFILNVGTIEKRKNLLSLAKAIKNTDIPLVIVGKKTRYYNEVKRYIKSNGIENRFLFLENLTATELAMLFQSATIFVYPSLFEGFGIPIIEALYSKTPVITTKYGCFPEAGGPDSIYIDPENENEIQNAITALWNDVAKQQEISALGFEYAQKFNDENLANIWHDVYTKINPSEVIDSRISGLVITYNEEKNIEELIKNIDFVDEIIIVDSISSDKTKAIATQFPKVKFIENKFIDFTTQRNFALQHAQYNWVLFMDGDERVTPELKEEIIETTKKVNSEDAYYFYRKYYYKKKPIHFSGTQTDKNFRLFKRDKAIYTAEKLVHETLTVNGTIGKLKHKLIHYSFDNYTAYKSKMIHYGQLKAKELYLKNKKFTYLHLIFKPIYKFLYNYFIRLGVLDGIMGFNICYLHALSVYATYKRLQILKK